MQRKIEEIIQFSLTINSDRATVTVRPIARNDSQIDRFRNRDIRLYNRESSTRAAGSWTVDGTPSYSNGRNTAAFYRIPPASDGSECFCWCKICRNSSRDTASVTCERTRFSAVTIPYDLKAKFELSLMCIVHNKRRVWSSRSWSSEWVIFNVLLYFVQYDKISSKVYRKIIRFLLIAINLGNA